jgi:hypothetical protein
MATIAAAPSRKNSDDVCIDPISFMDTKISTREKYTICLCVHLLRYSDKKTEKERETGKKRRMSSDHLTDMDDRAGPERHDPHDIPPHETGPQDGRY